MTSASSKSPITSTIPLSLSIFTRARTGKCTVRSIRSCGRRSRTVISLPETLTSSGWTGAPGEVACKLDFDFSLSEVMTVTRPMRFLIVSVFLPSDVNSCSYVCAEDGAAANTTSKQPQTIVGIRRKDRVKNPGANTGGKNIATDLACDIADGQVKRRGFFC